MKGLLKQAFDVSEVNRNESITMIIKAVYQNEQNNQWRKFAGITGYKNRLNNLRKMFLFYLDAKENFAF